MKAIIMFLLAVIIVVLIITAVIFIGNLLSSWYSFNFHNLNSKSYGHITTLTWKQVKDFYAVNPKRWRFEPIVIEECETLTTNNKFLLYNTGTRWSKLIYNSIYEEASKIIRVQLSFIDYLKFMHYSDYPKDNEGLSMVLDTVSKDIDVIKAEAQNQIKEAAKNMKEIRERMIKDATMD